MPAANPLFCPRDADRIARVAFREPVVAQAVSADDRDGTSADSYRVLLILAHLDLAAKIQELLRQTLARHQLTALQFRLSLVLQAKGPSALSASALAKHACVSRSAATTTVDQLEKKGFVARCRNPQDRRIIGIQLTPAGAQNARNALSAYRKTAAAAASRVSVPLVRSSLDLHAAIQLSLSRF